MLKDLVNNFLKNECVVDMPGLATTPGVILEVGSKYTRLLSFAPE